MRRPCARHDCAEYVSVGSYCPAHLAERQRRAPTALRGYGGGWRRLSERVRRRWVAEHGLLCQGWQREAHPVGSFTDLCLDHDGWVLCRQCNGRKGGGWDKRQDRPKGGSRVAIP